jgi:hypothetical protein
MVFTVRPTFFEATRDQWVTTLQNHGMGDVTVTYKPYTSDGLEAPIVSCFKR